MPDSLSQFYHTEIVHTGRLPMLVLLGGIIVTFLLIRLNTRLIRANVRWWPGNFEKGDVHVHHIAIGVPFLFVCGVLEFAFRPGWPWVEIIALIFGGAAALVFDEYALILHVRDVYWKEEGRHSVVAVFLAAIFAAFLVVGVVPGSDAAKAGREEGDLITRIDDEPVERWSQQRYEALVAQADEIAFTFYEGRRDFVLKLKVMDLVP